MSYSHVVDHTPNACWLESGQSAAVLVRTCMTVLLWVSLGALGTITPPAFYFPTCPGPMALSKYWNDIIRIRRSF